MLTWEPPSALLPTLPLLGSPSVSEILLLVVVVIEAGVDEGASNALPLPNTPAPELESEPEREMEEVKIPPLDDAAAEVVPPLPLLLPNIAVGAPPSLLNRPPPPLPIPEPLPSDAKPLQTTPEPKPRDRPDELERNGLLTACVPLLLPLAPNGLAFAAGAGAGADAGAGA